MRVIYRLLGPVRVEPDDHPPLKLPGGVSRTVLAVLLFNANKPMTKHQLIKAAWGPDGVDEAQLTKSASTLRKLLGSIDRGGDLKTLQGLGYQIQVAPETLDLLRFDDLVEQASTARKERRSDDEAALLRRGLALWEGPHPLSNVSPEHLRREKADLEERRKRAAVRLFDLGLARRAYAAILDELAVIFSYHPDDGRLAEQLMIVQYRCGHVSDANAAFNRHRDSLLELAGRDPDLRLRDLNYAIGSEDETRVAAAERAIVRRAGIAGLGQADQPPLIPRQLPSDLADLIGRDDLAAEASWMLSRDPGRAAPVVVISGPGGIGKTTLAVRVGHTVTERYPDGQLYAELRGTDEPVDPAEMLAQFLRALGVTVIPESRAERATMYRTLLASRRVLIVLDDAEDGPQVRDLIPANPACGVLVTARRRLPYLVGSHHVAPLTPLATRLATELFLRVTSNACIDLSGEMDAVERVVRLCGGLPLALRIAGALRVHDHPQPTRELAARLELRGPDVLTYSTDSVSRTISAGFDRLDASAQRLFLDFGLLALPSFGLWTAAALLEGSGADSAAAVSQLASRYMIEPIEPAARYRFHDLTRDYARRRAQAAYPEAAARDAIAERAYRALLTLARRAHRALYGGDFEVVHSEVPDWAVPPEALAEAEAAPLDWFDKERLNIRAAVSHCASLGLTSICWDLAVSAHEFFTRRNQFDDWQATHQVALEACRAAGDRRGEGVMLASLGQPALVASRRAGVSGLAELERAVELLTECGDRHGQAIALRTMANALRRRGHLTRPLKLFEQALEGYEASGDRVGRWQTMRYIGTAYLDLGRRDDARCRLRDALIAALELGKSRLIAQTQFWIGQAALAGGELDSGELAEAKDAFEEVCRLYPEPTGLGHAYAVLGLGVLALREGKVTEAESHLSQAARLAGKADAALEGRAWLAIAELRGELGQQGKRLGALTAAVRCFGDDSVYLQAQALSELASAQADAGNEGAAHAMRARVARLYSDMGLPEEDQIFRRRLQPVR